MLDTRYWLLVTRYSLLVAGCKMQDTRCRMHDAGSWISGTWYWGLGMNIELARGEQALARRLCGGLVRLRRIERPTSNVE